MYSKAIFLPSQNDIKELGGRLQQAPLVGAALLGKTSKLEVHQRSPGRAWELGVLDEEARGIFHQQVALGSVFVQPGTPQESVWKWGVVHFIGRSEQRNITHSKVSCTDK